MTEADAQKSLDDIDSWFKRTFNVKEWQVTSSVFKNVTGFGAELIGKKEI